MGYPFRAMVRRLAERVYADVLMPSRLGAYAELLGTALEVEVGRRGVARVPAAWHRHSFLPPVEVGPRLMADIAKAGSETSCQYEEWRVARWTNALDDLQRVVEALRFDDSRRRDRRTRSDGLP